MDFTRRLFHTKADLEPTLGNPGADARTGKQSQSKEPSAPPMPGKEPEVSSKPVDTALYHMAVIRTDVDNPYIVLYQNKVGLVYRALKWYKKVYPHNNVLHVYGNKESSEIRMFDDWNNAYHHIREEKLMEYTWKGKRIFNLGKHPPPSPLKAEDTMKPKDSEFKISTLKYVPPLDATFKDMHMDPPGPMGDGHFGGTRAGISIPMNRSYISLSKSKTNISLSYFHF